MNEKVGSLLHVTNRPEVVMQKGKGMYLWDNKGKKYLDFIGGWAVNTLGHCPQVMIEALNNQAKELINCSPSFYNEPMLEFADLLVANSCFDKVFFINSGAEANESAIKLARKYGEKYKGGAYEVITTKHSFHGRTLATMSATGKEKWKALFAPKLEGFIHVDFNDIEAVKEAITPKTCAIMLEPIQGEGGVNVADQAYIEALRKLCDEEEILLIFDEVQTGIGRCGTLFAYEGYGVEPDIMTLAKGVGGGYPLAAMLTKEKWDIFDAGDQGGTFSSQPLGMAVGLAVVKEVLKQKLDVHAKEMGDYIKVQLEGIKERYQLSHIRGKGLLLAFDLPQEKGSELVKKCLEEGLIINSPAPHIIRLIPPLIVNKEEVDEMLRFLTKVLESIS